MSESFLTVCLSPVRISGNSVLRWLSSAVFALTCSRVSVFGTRLSTMSLITAFHSLLTWVSRLVSGRQKSSTQWRTKYDGGKLCLKVTPSTTCWNKQYTKRMLRGKQRRWKRVRLNQVMYSRCMNRSSTENQSTASTTLSSRAIKCPRLNPRRILHVVL